MLPQLECNFCHDRTSLFGSDKADIMSTMDFWNAYREVVARLFSPLSERDGLSEAQISAVETRFGFRLPGTLRAFYLIAGKREDLNQVYNRLLLPEDLYIAEQYLVFYE